MGITKENAKDFIGKWCLHDENRTGHYTKLFVNDIKEVKTGLDDGDERSLMIEYSYDKKRWQYADLTLFDHGDFIVSPFKEIKPEENEKAESSNDMKDDHHASSWFWKSVSRCENDQHDWVETDLMCYPPKKAQMCRRCGAMRYDN